MRRRGLLLLWGALAVGAQVVPSLLPRGAARADPPASHTPVLAYRIRARLDPATHEVKAQGVLTWRNTTSVPVPDFHVHLYLNAFRDRHSTFLRESHQHRGADHDAEHPGSIEVTSFRTAAGVDLRPGATFSSCDDANPDDKTVLVLALPEPIAPGASATFHVDWVSRLPKAFARTGFGGDYHMVVQWYPKPGVFEESEQGGVVDADWNCHQYHASSEFFADYGEYDVTITVPTAYEGRVGATGQSVALAEGTPQEPGTVTYRFTAKDVHDFAWVCDTDFVVKEHEFKGSPEDVPEDLQKQVAALLGRDVRDLDLPRVKVRLLLQPEHVDQEERHKQAVFHSLRWMGLWFGPYPYPTLTVVDPDHRAEDTGGMEYPTLITAGTDYVLHPRGWDPEFVTVHEFGHQYFYGLVGTNEFEHAWMDEGLNTYGTARTLAAAYPPVPTLTWYAGRPLEGEQPLAWDGLLEGLRKGLPGLARRLTDDVRIPWGKVGFLRSAGEALGTSPPDDVPLLPEPPKRQGPDAIGYLRDAPFLTLLPILPVTVAEHERTRVARRPVVDPIAGVKAWEYMDGASYGQNSYRRTAASLRTIEALVGEEVLLRGLRTYVDRYRFRHPGPEDLFRTLTEVADKEGRPGMRALLKALFERTDTVDYGVEALDVLDPGDDDHEGRARPADPLVAPRLPESTVLLRRHGEARLPVDVLVRFEDGSERRVRWELDGKVSTQDGLPPPLQPIQPKGEQGRWTKVRFVHKAKVASAEVDPRHLLNLEHDRTNDGLVREPDGPSPVLPLTVRMLGWVEMLTSFYGGL